MTKSIVNLCNAVLACDAVKEGTKAWARDLLARAKGADPMDWIARFGQ
jgi:hypothetical protein